MTTTLTRKTLDGADIALTDTEATVADAILAHLRAHGQATFAQLLPLVPETDERKADAILGHALEALGRAGLVQMEISAPRMLDRIAWLSDGSTTSVEAAGEHLAAARDDLAQATRIARAVVERATAAGLSEHKAARLAGVTRMTVRSWAGK